MGKKTIFFLFAAFFLNFEIQMFANRLLVQVLNFQVVCVFWSTRQQIQFVRLLRASPPKFRFVQNVFSNLPRAYGLPGICYS